MNFGSQPNILCSSRQNKLNPKLGRSLNNLNTVAGPPDPTFLEEVGSGTYSVVYKCKLEANGPVLAAKVMKMNPSEGAPGTAIREASILKLLKHDNIVTLHEVIYKPGKLTLVFEYIEDNLSNYMGKHDLPKDSATVQRFSSNIFQGLAYIHKTNILHRDLKPENTLITNNGILKIADFGMARQKFLPKCSMETRVATLWYKPPEILLTGCKYDFGIDIWSAGCIVYEMMNGEVLFKGTDFVTQTCKIFQILGVPPQSYWPELRLNQTFQVIQGNLEESYPATTLQTYDIKTPLRDRFTHPSNRHWRENAAAFSLLEACLQPCESKRIAAEDALKMDFLAECVAPSKIDQDSTRCNISTNDSRGNFKSCLRTSLSPQPPPQLPQRKTRKRERDACSLSSVLRTPSSGSGVTSRLIPTAHQYIPKSPSYQHASPPPIPPRVRSHRANTVPSGLSKSMELS